MSEGVDKVVMASHPLTFQAIPPLAHQLSPVVVAAKIDGLVAS